MLTPSEQDAMPHVLLTWARWADGPLWAVHGARSAATLDAIFDAMPPSPASTATRPRSAWSPRWSPGCCPDDDLEALARRAFAFPLLRGTYHGIDLSGLDPARPADRRSLLAADHDDQFGPPVTDQHVERHVALADRLWRDDPPELWDAAQRLLDLGEDRHSVLHALMTRDPARQATTRRDDRRRRWPTWPPRSREVTPARRSSTSTPTSASDSAPGASVTTRRC